jgi:hypothetical protein
MPFVKVFELACDADRFRTLAGLTTNQVFGGHLPDPDRALWRLVRLHQT